MNNLTLDKAYEILSILRKPSTTHAVRKAMNDIPRKRLQDHLNNLLYSGHIELDGVSTHITSKKASRLPYVYHTTWLGNYFISRYDEAKRVLKTYNLDARRRVTKDGHRIQIPEFRLTHITIDNSPASRVHELAQTSPQSTTQNLQSR